MHNISVVIPLFNKEAEIGRGLGSVIGQTRAPADIVVIDDGSTDAGAARVAQFDDARIRLIQQPNRGAAAARNRGIAEATGEWIAFLDADDEWKPGFLATLTELAARFPAAGLYAAGCDIVEAEGRVVAQRYQGVPTDGDGGRLPDFFASMTRYPPVNSSNTLCRHAIFDDVGGFPEGEPLAEDWDMWTRIALRRPVGYHPRVEAIYHTGAPNRTVTTRSFTDRDTALLTTLRAALEAGTFPYTRRESVEQFLAKHLLEIAKHLLIAGRRREARRRIAQAWPLHGARGKCVRWWVRSLMAR